MRTRRLIVHRPTPVRRLRTVGRLVAATLAAGGLVTAAPSPSLVQAVTELDMSGTPLRFVYSATDAQTGLSNPNGTHDGDVVVYRNVATVGGHVVDAVVTTGLAGAAIGNYDNTGSASSSNPVPGTVASENFQVDMTTSSTFGEVTVDFDFYEGGTYTGAGSGLPIVLQHVKVTSIDIDSSGSSDFQYTDMTSFQTYTLTNPSALTVQNPSAGVVRFLATYNNNGSNRPQDRVQVTYDAMSSFRAVFGNVASGKLGYFGLLFVADPWASCGCTLATQNNAFNQPPTSTDVTKYVAGGTATVVDASAFGAFSDPDDNPFTKVIVKVLPSPTDGVLEYDSGSSWDPVTADQEITLADIAAGKLRYTGTNDAAVQFRVHDGLDPSVANNTLTLLIAQNTQAITFSMPGPYAVSGGNIASGATASSGLVVTLTSSTPGVCTVSGLNVVPVSAGTCSITATQEGGVNGGQTYASATPVVQTFQLTALTVQTITFPQPSDQTYSGTTIGVASSATASSGLTVTLTSQTPSVCTVSGLDISVIGLGTCTVQATQAGNGTYAAATPVTRSFNVTAPPTTTSSTTTTSTTTTTTTTLPPTTTTSTTTTVAATTTTSTATTTPPVTTAAPTTEAPTTVAPTAPPTTIDLRPTPTTEVPRVPSTPIPVKGELPLTPPGSSQVYADGNPVPVEVTPSGTNGVQLVELGGVSVGMNGLCPSGVGSASVSTTASGGLALRVGSTCTAVVNGAGFQPESTVVLWALPNDGGEPVQLGSLSVLPDGSFLASAGLERLMAGQYTVQANGFAADGSLMSANLGITVTGADLLPATGSDSGGQMWLALGCVFAGAVLLLTSRRSGHRA
jgi:hypothetical protein